MEKQNGIITEYSIKYTAVDGEDDKPHKILGIPSDTTHYLLEQLEKWTEYRITVTAHTDVGPGPESLSMLIRTDEDGMLPLLRPFAPFQHNLGLLSFDRLIISRFFSAHLFYLASLLTSLFCQRLIFVTAWNLFFLIFLIFIFLLSI